MNAKVLYFIGGLAVVLCLIALPIVISWERIDELRKRRSDHLPIDTLYIGPTVVIYKIRVDDKTYLVSNKGGIVEHSKQAWR